MAQSAGCFQRDFSGEGAGWVEFVYSLHASLTLPKRGLSRASVEAIVAAPAWTSADPEDATVMRASGHATEYGDRWVRVVFRPLGPDRVFIVTACPDRDAEPPP